MQSMSLNASRSAPAARNPVMDLAQSMTALQNRVAGITVYTVANKDNELVLVAGEVCTCCCKLMQQQGTRPEAEMSMHTMVQHEGEKKQLGLFFFSEQDAQELMDQVSVTTAH